MRRHAASAFLFIGLFGIVASIGLATAETGTAPKPKIQVQGGGSFVGNTSRLNFTGASVATDAANGRINIGLATANPLVQSISDGSYTHALSVGGVSAGTWMKIAPGNPGHYVDLYGNFTSFGPTGGAPYDDNVFSFGPNCAKGGGSVDSAKMSSCFRMEDYFRAGHDQNETHIEVCPATGVGPCTRLFSGEQHTVGSTALFLAATQMQLGSGFGSGAPAQVSIAGTITIVQSPSLYNKALFDDGSNGYVNIQTGSSGAGANRASLNLNASDGQATLSGNGTNRLVGDGNVQVEWDGTNASLLSPDGTAKWLVNSGGLAANFGGNSILLIQSTTPRFTTGCGMYNVTPPASQPSSTGEAAFTNGGGSAVNQGFCSTGGTGTKCYTLGDIVKHLKSLGQLATN